MKDLPKLVFSKGMDRGALLLIQICTTDNDKKEGTRRCNIKLEMLLPSTAMAVAIVLARSVVLESDRFINSNSISIFSVPNLVNIMARNRVSDGCFDSSWPTPHGPLFHLLEPRSPFFPFESQVV